MNGSGLSDGTGDSGSSKLATAQAVVGIYSNLPYTAQASIFSGVVTIIVIAVMFIIYLVYGAIGIEKDIVSIFQNTHQQCDPGFTKLDGICYPNCAPGYTRRSDLPTMCVQNCPPNSEYAGAGNCARKFHLLKIDKIPGTCPPGYKNAGGICYKTCEAGKQDNGLYCMTRTCPPGFRDDGASCWQDSVKGRGTGHLRESDCRDKFGVPCEKNGIFWYPRCQNWLGDGWKNVGCCTCMRTGNLTCPPGFTSGGTNICWKNSTKKPTAHTRCAPGYFNLDGLGICYKCRGNTNPDGTCEPCEPGFKRVGLECKSDCGSMKSSTSFCSADTIETGVGKIPKLVTDRAP